MLYSDFWFGAVVSRSMGYRMMGYWMPALGYRSYADASLHLYTGDKLSSAIAIDTSRLIFEGRREQCFEMYS